MSRRKSKSSAAAKRATGTPARPASEHPRAARSATAGNPAIAAPPQVPWRWLLKAIGGTLAGAALCVWCALCLLFWQGSWQLLYHPSSDLTRTPAGAGLAFDTIAFEPGSSGVPRLSGWWIPAAPNAFDANITVLYLHSQDGNLSSAVDQLTQLHAAGVNVFAFDYRGYGQSRFAHPSEQRWLEDAGSAFQYLTATRHIDQHAIVLDGRGLGADLAVEFASAHPALAGVVADSPLDDATGVLFSDARAHLVPAHLLVSDRWDLAAAAQDLHVPSLWFLPFPGEPNKEPNNGAPAQNPPYFESVAAPKMFVWLPPGQATTVSFPAEFARWLDSIAPSTPRPAAPPSNGQAPAPLQQPKPAHRTAHRRHA
jgi:uncharacterized protein